MATRVVHLTVSHAPLDVRVFEKECRSLAANGYEVHLLVPHAVPGERQGVIFHPLPLGKGPRLLRIARRWAKAFLLARNLKARLYHLHDPELVPVGLLLKLNGARVVYDAHEDAPTEAISLNWNNPLWGRFLALVWHLLLALARLVFDGLIAATPHIAAKLSGCEAAVVRNFPRLDLFAEGSSLAMPYEQRGAIIAYVGTISRIRGLREMLGAMAMLPDDLHAELVLAGRFVSAETEAEARAHAGWHRVRYLGELSWEEVVAVLGTARLGLVVLHGTPEYRVSLPVKLFEYMASGLPVIASDFPLWRDIIVPADCGIQVDPLDEAAIADAIIELLRAPERAEQMGRCGQRAALQNYGWASEEAVLLALYRDVLG